LLSIFGHLRTQSRHPELLRNPQAAEEVPVGQGSWLPFFLVICVSSGGGHSCVEMK
jgi:nucleoid DNA-binding protein